MIAMIYCVLGVYKPDFVFLFNVGYIRAPRIMVDVAFFASNKLPGIWSLS